MVGRRDGPVRAADAEASGAQARERLGRGDLVDEVQVDGEDGRGAFVLDDDVVVPDLLDEGSGAGIGHGAAAPEMRRVEPEG